MSAQFERLHSTTGRPSISSEQLLRALLLQVPCTVRSERLLMEELDYNLLFRWFVGLNTDEAVWHPTTFTKNRDRLLEGDVARPSSTRSAVRRARPVCSPTSTSPWTARSWRPGRV